MNKSTMDKKGKESCQSSGDEIRNANVTDDPNRLSKTKKDTDEKGHLIGNKIKRQINGLRCLEIEKNTDKNCMKR